MNGRVKQHIKKHKLIYTNVATAVAFAGITCVIMRGRHAGVQRVPDGSETITVRPLSILSNQKSNVVTVIEREGRGHPGYRIMDLDTGVVHLSQADTARALNTYPSVISGHIQGKLSDANGHHLMRVTVKE